MTHEGEGQDGDGVRRLKVGQSSDMSGGHVDARRLTGSGVRKVKADLWVDGEVFGGAAVIWDGVAHRGVSKRLQRTRDVEFLIDHLRRQRHKVITH